MPVDVPRAMARAAQLGRPADVATAPATYHPRHGITWAAQDETQSACGAHLLDPLPYLCDGQFCQGADAGKPRYYDDSHLSETGNCRLVPLIANAFRNTIRNTLPNGAAAEKIDMKTPSSAYSTCARCYQNHSFPST